MQLGLRRPPSSSDRDAAATARPAARLVGVDLARFVAIVGMVAAHVWPGAPGDRYGLLAWSDGNASALFAVLSGVSIVLATRGHLADGEVAAARVAVLVRGAVVIVIGLTLAAVSSASPVVVVLVYIGAAMWAAVPLLTASSGAIAAVAAGLALGSAPLNAWLRSGMSSLAETGSISWTDLAHPLEVVRGTLATGTYPVTTWAVYLLVGVLVGRLLAAGADRRRLGLLALGGAAGAVLAMTAADTIYALWGRRMDIAALQPAVLHALPKGLTVDGLLRMSGFGAPALTWPALLDDSPHTGTLLDIARGSGLAVAVIALCSLAWMLAGHRTRRLLEPIRAAGAAPLTTYVVHVSLLGVIAVLVERHHEIAVLEVGPLAFAMQVLAVVAIGALLLAVGRRGPLEVLASWSARTAARSASRHPRPVVARHPLHLGGQDAETGSQLSAGAGDPRPAPLRQHRARRRRS